MWSLPFLTSAITPSAAAAALLASLLSWLALSFCFFLLVLEDRSELLSLPLPPLCWAPPRRPTVSLPPLLAIFRHLALTGRPSPESLPLLGSGSEVCLFLPGPAILAMILVWTLPEQNQEGCGGGGDLRWRAHRHLIIKTVIFMFLWHYLNYHYHSNKSVKINNSGDQDNAKKNTHKRQRFTV